MATPVDEHVAHDSTLWRGAAPPDVAVRARKLAPPPPGAVSVTRPRLISRLSTGVATTRVTLVSGPAGAGKSTLAAAWTRTNTEGRSVAWLTLAPEDDDPTRFWAVLAEALSRSGAGTDGPGTEACALTIEMPVTEAPLFWAERVRGHDQPVVLVLDNADCLTGLDVLAGLDEFIMLAGEGLRVVLCASADPGLPLRRYRGTGMLTEIRADELAFRPLEVVQLFQALDAPLSEQAATELGEHTHGGPVPLRLAAALVKRGIRADRLAAALAADDGPPVQFLVDAVLTGQPVELRRFLLRLSTMNDLWPGLVDRLCGYGTHRALPGLARTGSFVERVPGAPGGYRIPELVRAWLLAQQGELGDEHAM